MNRRERESLDRHITGNYGEDQFSDEERLPSTKYMLEQFADWDGDEGADAEYRLWLDSLTLAEFERHTDISFDATQRGVLQLAIALNPVDGAPVADEQSLPYFRIGHILESLAKAIDDGKLNTVGITWAKHLIDMIEGVD